MHQREENYVQYFDNVPVLTPYLVKKIEWSESVN